MKTIIKPWGKEEWLELNDKYCYKRIYIDAGHKTSYQYHEFKHETNYIISGEAEIWLENNEGIVEKKIMGPGEHFNVSPPKKHRVIALTDLILQEVSTPEVDDVIRIEDDTNRKDGKIENEHKTPAVLILTAGIGSRLKELTSTINKSLLPINNRAVISHIIDKFPKDYDFVIAVGYGGQSVKDYCELSHPNHSFTFVNVDKFTSDGSGPGYSALQCKEHLQRPFYLSTCDCLINDELPIMGGNWLGVYPTSYPEKYSTLETDEHNNIINYLNKSKDGYQDAFIGLSSIRDYDIFWSELEKNIKDGEIVSAFENPSKYPVFKTKKLRWMDTGNIGDLEYTKEFFRDEPLSLSKTNGEITYRENNTFIKYSPDLEITQNRGKRATILKELIPLNFKVTNNFISYDWSDGKTLYELDTVSIYCLFLDRLKNNIGKTSKGGDKNIKDFYQHKTQKRLEMFIIKNDNTYYNNEFIINGIEFPSLFNVLIKVENSVFLNNPFYSNFHGDMQFDNILYSHKFDSFKYIDWRDSFSGNTEKGDLYYDLAKMYGGCLIPYNKMKNEDNIFFEKEGDVVNFNYSVSDNLKEFFPLYEKWIIDNGYDLKTIKMITAIIFLNMSPLHDEKFSKMLWFKSIEMLYETIN